MQVAEETMVENHISADDIIPQSPRKACMLPLEAAEQARGQLLADRTRGRSVGLVRPEGKGHGRRRNDGSGLY
jgi:hypothetical protein